MSLLTGGGLRKNESGHGAIVCARSLIKPFQFEREHVEAAFEFGDASLERLLRHPCGLLEEHVDGGAGHLRNATDSVCKTQFTEAIVLFGSEAKADHSAARIWRHMNVDWSARRGGLFGLASGTLRGGNGFPIDFDRDGALEHFDGDDHAPLRFLLHEDAFDVLERAVGDANALTCAEEGAGLGGDAGIENGMDGFDFAIGDRRGLIAEADDGNHAWRRHDGQAILGVKTAEYVPGK